MVLDVLEEHDWHFALERSSALALSSSDVIGWDYKYAKPSGALRIVELADEDSFLDDEPFEEEGLYVYCNLEDAYCRYVSTVADPASFSPLFVDALAWRIAAEAAYRVTGKREKAEEMWQGFARAIERARLKDFYSTARSGNSDYTDEIIAEGTV